MKLAAATIAWSTGAMIAILATAGSAGASEYGMFRSPSGAIGCGYYEKTLRCDVIGGVKPLPPAPKSCELDWGAGFWLRQHGRASVVCAGDTSLDRNARVIRYGTTWRGDGITCASSTDGMRCVNTDGHGFAIARGDARRF
jgi:uncharacterized protein DUF6636